MKEKLCRDLVPGDIVTAIEGFPAPRIEEEIVVWHSQQKSVRMPVSFLPFLVVKIFPRGFSFLIPDGAECSVQFISHKKCWTEE